MRRRGSRMTGKNDPFRSFGIRSSTSPAWVANNRSRAPLRSVTRVPVRSYFAAPISSVASASISSCMTIRTDSRTRSTPSPVRNASSSSDTADWDKAIGEVPFGECLPVHTEDPADGPYIVGAAPPAPKTPPLHGRLLEPRSPRRWRGGNGPEGVTGGLHKNSTIANRSHQANALSDRLRGEPRSPRQGRRATDDSHQVFTSTNRPGEPGASAQTYGTRHTAGVCR